MPAKRLATLIIPILFLSLVFVHQLYAQGNSCGNGVCQSTKNSNEDCNTCPQDCGACATPTPTTEPTPQPTNEPTPPPDSGSGDNNTSSSGSDSTSQGDSSTPSAPAPNPDPTLSFSTIPDISGSETLTYTNTATSTETISNVQYSFNNSDWTNTTPLDGSFNSTSEPFTLSTTLNSGNHTLYIRYQYANGQTSSPTSTTFTINTIPPEVTINLDEQPLNTSTPTITGSVFSFFANIARVEASLNAGQTWQDIDFTQSRFSFTPEFLADDNYPLQIRATDTTGNITTTPPVELIIDTLPPIAGGFQASLGPIPLLPDSDNTLTTTLDTPFTFAISLKGGVTSAQITTDQNQTFDLTRLANSSIWTTDITITTQNATELTLNAIDGANNRLQKDLTTINTRTLTVNDPNGQTLDNASLTVHQLSPDTNTWKLWDATAYSQQNPIRSSGHFPILLPPGTYYLTASAPSYISTNSQIFTLIKPTAIDHAFQLRQPSNFTLFSRFISLITPPDSTTITIPTAKSQATTTNSDLSSLNFEYLDLTSFTNQDGIISIVSPWSQLSLLQLPTLSELSSSQNLLVINLHQSPSSTQALVSRGKYNFTAISDLTGQDTSLLNPTFLPFHIFIKQGQIVATQTGLQSAGQLTSTLNSL